MQYGQIAGNKAINSLIYRCFEDIEEGDQRRFVKKFSEQPPDSDQLMHTVRELVLGAYLNSCGYKARYDYRVHKQTPDWCILNGKGALQAIIELVNFHVDRATEEDIQNQRAIKPIIVVWRDAHKDNLSRLYDCIQYKALSYRDLVKLLALPYAIAIYGDIRAAVDLVEINECLFAESVGLFELYPHVSGVLYFEEHSVLFTFHYTSNPYCQRAMDLPSGVYRPKTSEM